MAKLVNNSTHTLEDVAPEAAKQALLKGTHGLVKGQPVNMFDAEGQPTNVDPAQVGDALQGGFRLADDSEVQAYQKDQENEAEYGEGAGNSARAFLAGAGRGATFGMSDQLLTKSGLASPEGLKQLEERHPYASIGGNVAGVATGLLTGSEEVGAAGAAADALNPVASVARAGRGIGASAEGVLGKYGSQALGSAVEGAAYGAGNVVSEQALGDHNLNAERIASELGIGAILGGGIGGAIGVASDAIPASLSKARELFGNTGASEYLQKGVAKASSVVSGKPYEKVLQAFKDAGGLMSEEATASASKELTDGLAEQYKTVNKAAKDAFKDIRPEETAHLLDSSYTPAASAELGRLNGVIGDTIKEIQENPALYPERYAIRLSQFRDSLVKDPGEAADIFKNLNDFKKQMDDHLMKFGREISPDLVDTQNLLKGLRGEIKNSLENEAVWGPAGARQATVNDVYSRFSYLQKQVQKDVMQKTFNQSGSVTHVVDPKKVARALKDEIKLGHLQDYHEASKELIDELHKSYSVLPNRNFDQESVKSILDKNTELQAKLANDAAMKQNMASLTPGGGGFLEGGLAAGAAHAGPLGTGAAVGYSMLRNPAVTAQRLAAIEKLLNKSVNRISGLSKAVFNKTTQSALVGETATLNAQSLKKAGRDIQSLAANPDHFTSVMSQATQHVYPFAPNTVGALHLTTSTAVNFLQSKLPQNPDQKPLDPEFTPSRTDIAKFNQYHQIVQNPLLALKQLKEGRLGHETIETLSTVYPGLYKEMQTAVHDALADHLASKKPIPHQQRLMLSMFLGQDLSSTLKPESILKNQQALQVSTAQAQAQKQAGGPRPSLGGMKQLSVADRAVTPMGQSARRSQS